MEAPEGGDVLRECVSEPQFPSMHSGNRGGSSSACSCLRPLSTGQDQDRGRGPGRYRARGPGRPADSASLDLYSFDPWGWKWRPLYRFALRTKGAHAQKDISQGL